MNDKKNLKKINVLKEQLVKNEENYYRGEEVISDELYDFKLRKLQALGVKTENMKVGHVHSERKQFKIEHRFPMISLSNAFNEQELFAFFDSHKKLLGMTDNDSPIEYFIEPKIDGVGIDLHYKNGQLIQAISRGDGKSGESLIHHIKNMQSIPKKINYLKEIFVRGEIFISKEDFQSIRESQTEGEKSFISARSYVAGTLRLKETEKVKEKKLSFTAYRVLMNEESEFKLQSSTIDFLRSFGFSTHDPKMTLTSSNISEILAFLKHFGDIRDGWGIPNDGLVIKVNCLEYYDKIGSTSKSPKWAIAYKYPSLIKETILEKIETTVGRSGRITYIGKLQPVYINGSWINWVSLHNHNNIKQLKLNEGMKVQVYKSGEIIPKVLSAVDSSDEIFPLITKCPSCYSKLAYKEGNTLQYCINPDCEGKKICKIIYFCSKNGVNIEGLSEKIITKLFQEGFIKTIIDIYSLKDRKEDLFSSKTLNIKEKSFNNLIQAIQKSLQVEPQKILSALGIEYIGGEVAKLFLRKFSTIDKICSSTLQEKLNIPGVGPKSAHSLEEWIKNSENQLLLDQLKKLGFNFHKPKDRFIPEITEHYLSGKKALITGKFSKSREEIKSILSSKYGVEFRDVISKEIDFLLVGENPGSKIQQARQNNIPILNQQVVEELLEIN